VATGGEAGDVERSAVSTSDRRGAIRSGTIDRREWCWDDGSRPEPGEEVLDPPDSRWRQWKEDYLFNVIVIGMVVVVVLPICAYVGLLIYVWLTDAQYGYCCGSE
jgi:hypothetical protein